MDNVVAYCRVSTEKTDQLNSFKAQKDFFAEYAKINGLNLVHIYADEGISGTKTKNRTEFNQMMKDSETGMFKTVLVKDISRLARNTVDLLQSIRKLRSLNIDTRFITANMGTLGESEFMLTIFGALAQEESANMSKRVKFGKQITAEKGRVPNLCYGYRKLVGEKYSLKIDEFEAQIVKYIYDLYVNQGYGQLAISKLLNDKGIKCTRGGGWTQTSVKRVLRNKLYAGYVINNKSEVTDFLTGKREKHTKDTWIEVKNDALRIIDLDTWNKAQEIADQQCTKYICNNTHKSNKFLFSTLIKCEDCGRSFRRLCKEYPNYTRTWWVCSTRNGLGKDACSNAQPLDEDKLIATIDTYLHDLINNQNEFIQKCRDDVARANLSDDDTVEIPDTAKSIEAATKRLEKLKSNKDKQIQLFEDDIISRDELKQRMGNINQEILDLEKELVNLKFIQITNKHDDNKYTQIVKQNIDNADKFMSEYVSIGNLTNAQIKMIIEKVTVNSNGNVKIYIKNI